jgi:uncharacterized protein YcbX
MSATLARICRYPVKGLTAEDIESIDLETGCAMPEDRRFAVAHGSAGLDAAQPEWRPKSDFATLLRNERLAKLEARFEPATGKLAIARDGRMVVESEATTPLGRVVLEQFFAAFLGEEARGGVRIIEAKDFIFSDVPQPWISIINLASVRDLERVTGAPIDPVRFRANLYVECERPWEEFGWVGRGITAGEARLKVIERIGRCAATEVNPATAERDMRILKSLQTGFGHTQMGVYAAVTAGGAIACGDSVTVI